MRGELSSLPSNVFILKVWWLHASLCVLLIFSNELININLNRQKIELKRGAGTGIEPVPPVQQADTPLLSELRRTLPTSDTLFVCSINHLFFQW
jgi:hypothetical protein